MKFGISTFVNDDTIDPVSLARAIEERGFESLAIAEHTHIPASRESAYPMGGDLPSIYYRTLDPFVTLAAAAAVTSRSSWSPASHCSSSATRSSRRRKPRAST